MLLKSVLSLSLSAIGGGSLVAYLISSSKVAQPIPSVDSNIQNLPTATSTTTPVEEATTTRPITSKAPSSRPTPTPNSPPTTPVDTSLKLPPYVKNHSKTTYSTKVFQSLYELGIPDDRDIHLFSGYLSATDTRLRIPSFVGWTIPGGEHPKERKSERTNSQFLTSPYLPEEFNANNSDYLEHGYDRGHLCPCGDFYYSLDQRALDETFYLSHNVLPQEPNNNRYYWLRMEMFTRGLAKNFDNLHVLAGPLFVPQESKTEVRETKKGKEAKKYVTYEVIGDNNVACPTHLFRILVGEKDKKYFIQAFMVPNKKIPKEQKLTDFIVPVSEIEKHSGLKLLHRVEKSKTQGLCKSFSCDLFPWQELEFQKVLWDKNTTADKIEKEWDRLVKEGWQPSPNMIQRKDKKIKELNK
ncbi:hypothetical protein ABK040_010121 [Willaertia magna]